MSYIGSVPTPAGFASRSEVTGTNTTGTISSGSNSLTVASATGINVGDFVVGEGIAPGTTVSAISGTTITLSGVVGAALSTDPVAFYIANKALSPGLVGSQLCRAWVNFNGTGTVAIRASFNVSSITDHGTGEYTVTYTTAMVDVNYAAFVSCGNNSSNGAYANLISLNSKSDSSNNYHEAPTTTSIRFIVENFAYSLMDSTHCYVAIFR